MMNTKPHHQFAAGRDDAYHPSSYMMNSTSSYSYDTTTRSSSTTTSYAYNYTTPGTDSERQQQHYYYSSASSPSAPVSLSDSPTSSSHSSNSSFQTSEGDSREGGLIKNKSDQKSSSFAYRIRDHVKLGPKLSETVKGKLSLGAWIVQQGGRANIFKQIFGVNDGEQLLKASQCYLSTTAGPIPGLLFISTHKLAFCSERSITLPTASGGGGGTTHHQLVRTPYKVQIPIRKIKRAEQSQNVNKPQQKYIEIVTQDDFEFWFMGFLRYEKAFTNLQKAISIHAAQQN